MSNRGLMSFRVTLFLALRGKYYAAMAILRKILEVHVRCAYLDSNQDQDEAENVLSNWISGGDFRRGFGKIVNELIDNHTDQDITHLLKGLCAFENGSFKKSILSMYAELCKYVHLRPLVQWNDDLRLPFSEFDPYRWSRYYLTFMEVIRLTEILLILKFPRIASMRGLGDTAETYSGLQLSKQELDAIAQFSCSCAR